MGDTKYWIQLVLSILVPLLTGAGLVQIREHLPNWFFLLFLSVLCIFIIVVLLRLAFGDWFRQVWIWWKKRTNYKKSCGIAKDWHQRFINLVDVISKVGANNWEPKQDESIRYLSLRGWFTKNRSELLPMWGLFMTSRVESNYTLEHYSLEYKIIHEHWQDPFSFFYDPITLDRMGDTLKISVGDIDHNSVRYVLVRLEELTNEFVYWVKHHYKM